MVSLYYEPYMVAATPIAPNHNRNTAVSLRGGPSSENPSTNAQADRFTGSPRERVASAASRVRVPRQFIYRWPIPSIDAQLETPAIAANLDRCRAAHVVGLARSALIEIQIPATASVGRFHRRLRLYRVPASNRNRRWSALRERCGHNPDGLAPQPGLESAPVLEQRRSKQYQRSRRNYSVRSQIRGDPHPPSPLGWAPPSPAVRERGYFK